MKSKHHLTFLFAVAATASVYAELINGGFDQAAVRDAETMNVAADLDQGWCAKEASLYDLSESDLWTTWLMIQPTYWFGQIYADHCVTVGDVDLDFTVNYMGRNIQNPELRYEIYGTDSTDVQTTLLALNSESNHVGSAWTLLSKGAIATPSEGDYSTDLNFSAAYKYIAVRFRVNGGVVGRGTDYAFALDNFSIRAVPEPAVILLLATGCMTTLLVRRFSGEKF